MLLFQWIYLVLVYPIIYILPAYVANGAPVIFGGGTPIDLNRKFKGRPILGKHKTIRGLIAGLLSGFLIAGVESIFLHYMLVIGILLSIGAMFGDIVGSFIKRRFEVREGNSVPLMDQYMFFVFALLFAFPLGNMPNLFGLVFIVLLTGLLHKTTNMIANRIHVKEVPW
ncbi:MAG: CDP-2,3-bis-(O-geranylgeranyl)-sn-glycerol synthase [Candidatus Marsarchaeota archaeon]|nr:CDP-2,3-bis-(O-geranylgeranyl)-sn-glycerol synthase [Candidatus Marsarchaeota archaeon]